MKSVIRTLVGCCLLLAGSTSCIDSRYDLTNLSKKFALGGDSLSIPLLSDNNKILVGDALKSLTGDSSALKQDSTNGNYSFEMSGDFAYTLDSAAKAEMGLSSLAIDDYSYNDNFTVEGINATDTKLAINGTSMQQVIDLGIGDINLDELSLNNKEAKGASFDLDFSSYQLSDEQRRIDIPDINISQGRIFGDAQLPEALSILTDNLPHEEIQLELPSNVINVDTREEFSSSVNLPAGLSNIGDIVLQGGEHPATLGITLQVENASSLLTSGRIIPSLEIYPSSIFGFAAAADIQDGTIRFTSADVMDKSNNFSIQKKFVLTSLNIGGDPVDGVLAINDKASASGKVTVEDISYYADEIARIQELGLKVMVTFNDIVIESLSFSIDNLSTSFGSNEEIDVNYELPEQIAGIGRIIMEDGSKIMFKLDECPQMSGLNDNLLIEYLNIQLPQAIKLQAQEGLDPSTNRLSITNRPYRPEEGFSITLPLDEIDMSSVPVTDGKLQWTDQITYEASILLQGTVNSKNLPTGKVTMGCNADFDLKVSDAVVNTNRIAHQLENLSFDFEQEICSPLEELSSINSATISEGTFITVNFKLPQLSTPIVAENVRVKLPKMMEFASHPNLNADNELCIDGTIPESIQLELRKLNINQEFVDGIIKIDEKLEASGTVALNSGQIHVKELTEALKENIEIDFRIDDIVISDLGAGIKGISYQMTDTFSVNENIEIPAELLRGDSLVFRDGAQLYLSIMAENLPDFDMPVSLAFSLRLPKFFRLEGADLTSGNTWQIKVNVENGKPIERAIYIKALDLSQFDLSDGQLHLDESLSYNANFHIDAGEISISDLSDKDIQAHVTAGFKGLSLRQIYGVIDPKIDPISESVSLDGLPSMLKDSENARLEINPVVKLNAKSNIAIPLTINGNLTPVTDGVSDDARRQEIFIELPKAHDGQMEEHNFWIAASNEDMPQDYTFVPLSVNDLLRIIPDELDFNFQVGTDTRQQHEVDLDTDYSAELHYEIVVPIAFGENSFFRLTDTLEMDFTEIGGYFDYVGESLAIAGQIENTIPLDLTAYLYALDENDQRLDIAPVRLAIKSGTLENPCITPVRVSVENKDHQLDKARAFEMEIRLSSNAQVANVPLSSEQYIKPTLMLKAVGGLIIDADNL